ncbi:uncharacterized protein LOC123498669 [Portunus trituberculatus]|uniref:uncharacterized protein LOC123498669 n=1 Tax=Portunus trituberculatus TaxID=210409 RepID=UPI001E1D186C|nr:uncharacterized protein LOC123498669 [Portunus trituberculatus]
MTLQMPLWQPVDARQWQVSAVVRWTKVRVRRAPRYLHMWWTWRYICSFTKLIPEQVMKLENLLMEDEDVFSRDAQDFGCMSLVQHSINTAGSLQVKQSHSRVLLAKREMMQLPLDLATDGARVCSGVAAADGGHVATADKQGDPCCGYTCSSCIT